MRMPGGSPTLVNNRLTGRSHSFGELRFEGAKCASERAHISYCDRFAVEGTALKPCGQVREPHGAYLCASALHSVNLYGQPLVLVQKCGQAFDTLVSVFGEGCQHVVHYVRRQTVDQRVDASMVEFRGALIFGPVRRLGGDRENAGQSIGNRRLQRFLLHGLCDVTVHAGF